MSEKKKQITDNIVDNTKYIKCQVEDEFKKSFMSYAMAVNISRAIPDVRDGLKPVHRRILYSMGELNLYSDKPHRKCARIVGDVLGKYHPHGDSAVYGALVRLAQDFSIRYPLVDGHGNFGSVDGDPPAAQRYTEARLAKISSEMLRDIDKETVDYYPNFDDSLMQPSVLPSRFPNLLVNGSDGIAVGMATNIPPHNLNEVVSGVCALIENPDITIDELMEYIPAPDYPTGAQIMGRNNIKQAYRTGHGGIVIRSKTAIEEYAGNKDGSNMRQRIVVTELPYQVNKSMLIETIADMVKDKRLEGISDIKEESDRTGLRIVIEVKRDAQATVVLNTLFKHTNLQVSNGITFLALVKNEPKVLNLKEMLFYYLEHQKEIVVRRTRYDLEKAQEKAHILEGLMIALSNIDEVIAIIKKSRDKMEATKNLTESFLLSDKQANAILEMRLSRLTSLEVDKIQEELNLLRDMITDFMDILARPERVIEIVKNELNEVSDKYNNPRRSELCIDYDEIDIGDLIDREDVVISMTHSGYVKRLPVSEYKSQHRGGKGVTAHKPKDEDFVENMFVTCTHDDLLFFTNFGRVYCIKAYEVPEAQKTARGRAIVNILKLSDGEKVTTIIPLCEKVSATTVNETNENITIANTTNENVAIADTSSDNASAEITDGIEMTDSAESDSTSTNSSRQGTLIMATKYGLVKRTALSQFEKIRKGGKIAIKLNEGDELVNVQITSGNDEILLASSLGKCIRFSEKGVRLMGRDTQGVKSIKLGEGDYVVDMTILDDNCEIITVSEFGYGKRTDSTDYRLQSRAGKGVKAGNFNEKTGKLVNLKQVKPTDDIMVIADNGIIIRLNVSGISKISRGTQGVRLMKTLNDSKVVCLAIAQKEEELVSTNLDLSEANENDRSLSGDDRMMDSFDRDASDIEQASSDDMTAIGNNSNSESDSNNNNDSENDDNSVAEDGKDE